MLFYERMEHEPSEDHLEESSVKIDLEEESSVTSEDEELPTYKIDLTKDLLNVSVGCFHI